MWVPTGHPHRPAGGKSPQAPGSPTSFSEAFGPEKEMEINVSSGISSALCGAAASLPAPFFGWPESEL